MVDQELRREKKKAMKIAKELYYPDEVLARIGEAKSVNEIDRILRDARCCA